MVAIQDASTTSLHMRRGNEEQSATQPAAKPQWRVRDKKITEFLKLMEDFPSSIEKNDQHSTLDPVPSSIEKNDQHSTLDPIPSSIEKNDQHPTSHPVPWPTFKGPAMIAGNLREPIPANPSKVADFLEAVLHDYADGNTDLQTKLLEDVRTKFDPEHGAVVISRGMDLAVVVGAEIIQEGVAELESRIKTPRKRQKWWRIGK